MKYEKFTDELKEFITKTYLDTYSTTKVQEGVKLHFDPLMGRSPIVDYLKSVNLYEGLNGSNYLKKKVELQVKLLQEKYGVSNWGQMSDGGWKIQNKIPYKKIKMIDEIVEYKKQVEKLTYKTIKKMKKLGNIPTHCEYTNVLFADSEGTPNPNDPRKRTVDHVVPVSHCFLLGWSPGKAASEDNIKYILRLVNTMKGNSDYTSFAPLIPVLKRAFDEDC
jgi:hypothetical protein